MSKKIDKIDLFKKPINITELRNCTNEEIKNKIKNGTFKNVSDLTVKEKIKEIKNNYELAETVLKNNISIDCDLENALLKNKNYKNALSKKTPKALEIYQQSNDKKNIQKVNEMIS